jgi:hypothetical protein
MVIVPYSPIQPKVLSDTLFVFRAKQHNLVPRDAEQKATLISCAFEKKHVSVGRWKTFSCYRCWPLPFPWIITAIWHADRDLCSLCVRPSVLLCTVLLKHTFKLQIFIFNKKPCNMGGDCRVWGRNSLNDPHFRVYKGKGGGRAWLF